MTTSQLDGSETIEVVDSAMVSIRQAETDDIKLDHAADGACASRRSIPQGLEESQPDIRNG